MIFLTPLNKFTTDGIEICTHWNGNIPAANLYCVCYCNMMRFPLSYRLNGIIHRKFSSESFKQARAAKKAEGRKKMIYVGVPMVGFVLGGFYVLSLFLGTHMEMKDKQKKSTTVRKFDLEEEHKVLMKQLNVEDFSLSRIPRPEDANSRKKKDVVSFTPVPTLDRSNDNDEEYE